MENIEFSPLSHQNVYNIIIYMAIILRDRDRREPEQEVESMLQTCIGIGITDQ